LFLCHWMNPFEATLSSRDQRRRAIGLA